MGSMNHRGNSVGSLFELGFERMQAVHMAGLSLEAERTLETVRRVSADDREEQRLERRCEHRLGADGHGPDSVAVVRVFECENQLALRLPFVPPILTCELDRDFDGGGPVV